MNEWNRNDEWELQRTYHERAVIVLTIPDRARASYCATLRRLIPEFRNVPPAEMLMQVRKRRELHLTEMSGREARRLETALTEAGIQNRGVDTSVVSFLPINKSKGFAWLIEDAKEMERITRQMISEGVKISEVEA